MHCRHTQLNAHTDTPSYVWKKRGIKQHSAQTHAYNKNSQVSKGVPTSTHTHKTILMSMLKAVIYTHAHTFNFHTHKETIVLISKQDTGTCTPITHNLLTHTRSTIAF